MAAAIVEFLPSEATMALTIVPTSISRSYRSGLGDMLPLMFGHGLRLRRPFEAFNPGGRLATRRAFWLNGTTPGNT